MFGEIIIVTVITAMGGRIVMSSCFLYNYTQFQKAIPKELIFLCSDGQVILSREICVKSFYYGETLYIHHNNLGIPNKRKWGKNAVV